jgi:hypothetical protein
MMTNRFYSTLLAGCFFLSAGLRAGEAQPGDLKFQVALIWGTNKENPTDPTLKEVDPKLKEGLQKIFKWKHYYEVKRDSNKEPFVVAKKGSSERKLSEKCKIEARQIDGRDSGKPMLEVKVIGEGNWVKTVRQPVVPKEYLTIAGDDKNDTAWFIVLTPK